MTCSRVAMESRELAETKARTRVFLVKQRLKLSLLEKFVDLIVGACVILETKRQ